MEVILLKKCRQGNIGDIVTVKDGFARNKLIPCGEAQRATAENKKEFERKRKELEAINLQLLSAAEAIKDKLASASISVVREASSDMKLYGAVSVNDIAAALHAKYGVEIDPKSVAISKRIKEVGVCNDIYVKLHHDVVVQVELNVLPQESK
jgi:large subunit ribosomal protein L9